MTQFYGKTKICYGPYALKTLEEVPAKRAFIVTDPFMVKSGFINIVQSHLDRKGTAYTVFDQVEPDPSLETVVKGAAAYLHNATDIVIALGGGSAIDAAKAIVFFGTSAASDIVNNSTLGTYTAGSYATGTEPITGKTGLAGFGGNISFGSHTNTPPPKPLLIAIPTTAGTGSEVTSISVITDKINGVKIPLNDEALIPDIAILDARFTRTVPPHVTAATGMDVLTHALEAYTSRRANAFSTIYAEHAIRCVFKYLERAYTCMDDMEAREMMLLGSCMAGMAFNNSALGITHSIAHSLGGIFHIPHGLANAVMLPYVMRFNSFDAGVKYCEIATMLALPATTVEEGCTSLIQAVSALNQKLGIAKNLRELKIDNSALKQHIPAMAQNALEDICTSGNPRCPSAEDIKRIIETAW